MISVPTFMSCALVAAAVLALWVTARCPKLGPKSLRAAVALLAVGFALLQFLPVGVDLLVRVPNGGYVAIFGCVLPCFFGMFLTAAWMLRLLAGKFGGSNGDRGLHVPAPARG